MFRLFRLIYVFLQKTVKGQKNRVDKGEHMGILTKIRNGIIKSGEKAADGIANMSQLSPVQVREIDDKRSRFLQEKPSADDERAEELTRRNMAAIAIEVNNAYLPQISNLYLPIREGANFDAINRITYFEICKWVKDPNENSIEKMMNVYQVLSEEKCNIALIYNRTVKECTIYLAVVNNGKESDANEVDSYKKRLLGALKGNFPGAELITENREIRGFGVSVPECLRVNVKEEKETRSVAIVSNLATEKADKFTGQTIEKVLDGIIPKTDKEEYTIVLLATPLREQLERKNRLYELYSALAPYANWQTNYTYTEFQGLSSSSTFGLNIGASVGTQWGVGRSEGITNSQTSSETKSSAVNASVGVPLSLIHI